MTLMHAGRPVFLAVTAIALGVSCDRNQVPVIDPTVGTTSTQKNEYDEEGQLAAVKLTLTLEIKASDPDGDSLQYVWTSTGGTLKGAGNKASWEGAQKGDTARVTVADGRGGTAIVNFEHSGVEVRNQIIYQ